jgi:hypothetical protein
MATQTSAIAANPSGIQRVVIKRIVAVRCWLDDHRDADEGLAVAEGLALAAVGVTVAVFLIQPLQNWGTATVNWAQAQLGVG